MARLRAVATLRPLAGRPRRMFAPRAEARASRDHGRAAGRPPARTQGAAVRDGAMGESRADPASRCRVGHQVAPALSPRTGRSATTRRGGGRDHGSSRIILSESLCRGTNCGFCGGNQRGAAARGGGGPRPRAAGRGAARPGQRDRSRRAGCRAAAARAAPASARGRLRGGPDGAPPGDGRAAGQAGQDRPGRRAGNCAADPHGPVRPGESQVRLGAGAARVSPRARERRARPSFRCRRPSHQSGDTRGASAGSGRCAALRPASSAPVETASPAVPSAEPVRRHPRRAAGRGGRGDRRGEGRECPRGPRAGWSLSAGPRPVIGAGRRGHPLGRRLARHRTPCACRRRAAPLPLARPQQERPPCPTTA